MADDVQPETEGTAVVTLSKKVCLLGDFAVGKTSLVRRFVYDLFDDKYVSTIGVKVSRKTVILTRGARGWLQLRQASHEPDPRTAEI